MPRIAASIDSIIAEAIRPAVARASEAIARLMADAVTERVYQELRKRVRQPAGRMKRRRSSARKEIRKWIADRRARRVPTFVIEATGFETKKKIVAKYGPNAAFEKGKGLPPVAEKSSADAKPEVRAKPPIIRKKGKAA
jgi:hypothetical protein